MNYRKKFTSTFTTESPDDRKSPGLSLWSFFIVLILTIMIAGTSLPKVYAEDGEDDNLYLPVQVDYDRSYDVFERINNERSKRGVATLSMDQTLMDAAYVRAVETIVYFEHARPNGGTWYSVSEKVNGENLGMGTGSASEIMKLWMESEGHKENIIRPEFRSVGVACVEYGDIYYWVQLFGTGGSDGAERLKNKKASMPIDLPAEEEGGEFAYDYSITVDGFEKDEATAEDGKKYILGLRAESFNFDPSKLKWKNSNDDVANINGDGVMEITGKGRTEITASSGSIERAALSIDSRADMKDMFIMDSFSHMPELSASGLEGQESARPVVTVLSNEGPLVKDRDYCVIYKDGDEGEVTAEICGLGGYKGIVKKAYSAPVADK